MTQSYLVSAQGIPMIVRTLPSDAQMRQKMCCILPPDLWWHSYCRREAELVQFLEFVVDLQRNKDCVTCAMGCDIDSNAGWRGRRNTGLRQDCSLSHPHVGRDAILETATRSALRVRHLRPNVEQSRHAVGDGTCAASPSQACVDRGANKRWHRCRQVEVPQTFARS
jgi:hypothetical protein